MHGLLKTSLVPDMEKKIENTVTMSWYENKIKVLFYKIQVFYTYMYRYPFVAN